MSDKAPLILATVMILVTFSCKTQKSVEGTEVAVAPAVDQIMLSEAQIQLANIDVAPVREGTIGRRLSLTGVLKVDEKSAYTVSSRIPGRIEKLYFKNTGETVRKGDKLYDFYSEDLITAEREYFRLQSNNRNFNARYEPSLDIEETLQIMGLTLPQIRQMGKDGKILFTVTILSPASGKIRAINVSEGQYVTGAQPLYELASDNTLWVEAQVYPDEIRLLRPGMQAILMIPAAGEAPVLCRISFINPSYETGKNVTLVRAVIDNPDNRLHPGMFAILHVRTATTRGIIIPASAVITESNGERVWVMEEPGVYSGRTVTTGIESGDSVLVLSGLKPDDMVVTSGVYLLNSELILKRGTDAQAPSGGDAYQAEENAENQKDEL